MTIERRTYPGAAKTGRVQQGQALVLALALLVVGLASSFYLFNVGQHLGSKSRLVTAVDSAAFSAAVWRARVFNYIAYSNRAIIAQEVAIAQAITLQSWAWYFEVFTENVDDAATFFPPAKVFTQAVHEAAELSKEIADIAATTEITLRDRPKTGYKTLLQNSQAIMRYAGGGFGVSAVALEVAKANDKRVFAFAMPDHKAYQTFSRRFSSDDDRARMKDVVMRSLDPFTRSRGVNHHLSAPLPCPGSLLSATDTTIQMRKRGGTTLAPGLERWEAADTLSLQMPTISRWTGRCKMVEIAPLGWGASEIANPREEDDLFGNAGKVRQNRQARQFAINDMDNEGDNGHIGTGIARVYDLNLRALTNKRFPVSRLLVLGAIKGGDIRDLSALGYQDSRRLNASADLPGRRQWAIAAAEVFFRRPPGTGRDNELASLYNPYWQARLRPVRDSEKQQAERYRAR